MIPVLAASQFDPGAGRVEMTLPEGLTVADIVRQALPGATAVDLKRIRVALVSTSGASIAAPALWHAIRPKPGVRVVIRVIPGKGGLKAVLSIVVSIAAVALGTMFGPAIGGLLGLSGATATAVGGALVAMGVNLVGQLLINALVPPVKPDTERRNTYSISGWRNRLDPDGAVPEVLGSIRYAPPYAARPYTEIVGDWQYIRALFVFGEGELQLTDFRIGETSISEYDEVQLEVRYGLPGDLPCSYYPRQVHEESIGVDLTRPLPRDDSGEVIKDQPTTETPVVRTSGRDASGASIILAFPAGLFRLDDGKKRTHSVQVRVEQRLAGAENWQAVTTLTISSKRAEGFYRQHSWSFPSRGRWEVRLTMLTDESDSTDVSQRTAWAALQTIRPEYPIAYDRPLALVAVRVKATHQLSGALDNFSALATRICLDWDHATGTWIKRATSNPASLYRHILQSPANPKAVPDAEIDLQQLQDWHDFCRVRGLHYNRVLDQAGTSVRDALTEVAAAGRATPRHDGMRWGVVIDRPSELIVDHASPRNSWNFSVRRVYAEKPHAFVVTFQDETNDYKEAKRYIPRPGYTGPIELTEPLSLPGLTDPAIIYREGLRRWFETIHRPDVYEVTQDGAVRVATRGDTIALSSDVISTVQKAARVKSVQGNRVLLDDQVTMLVGQDYACRFRRVSAEDTVGSSPVRNVVTEPGATEILTLTGSGPMPQPDDLLLFGLAGQESYRLVVTQTEATEDMCTILRCVDAAPEIDALTDAAEIPAWSGRVGAEISENFVEPSAPRFAEISSRTVTILLPVSIDFLIEPGSGVVASALFEIDHREAGTTSWTTITIPVADGGGTITGYHSGEDVEIRARAISDTGVPGPYGPVVTHLVGSGGVGIPAALDGDSITVTALLGGGLIQFAAGTDPNLAQVQLYRSMSAVLDRETDAVGEPMPVAAAQSYSFAVGDTTRASLLASNGWTAGAGWTVTGGEATHAPGSAGDLSQPVTVQTGRWYRVGFTVSDCIGGTVTPLLAGGSTVAGTPASADGLHRDRLQAVTGNDSFELAATDAFDGTVAGIVAYLETAACLAQGTHYLWLEPQSEDGLAGPAAGPFTLEVI
ncbi:host specificity factor TipJ family phage tail protein [Paracoccus denitrificans]|uniref:host specificity factor TipJ family phage tail protein n=1 Tax=Paracoccus denitrificans TaxID=266 RepID=UPI0033650541